MIKVFIGQPLPNIPIVELIRPNLKAIGLDRWTERHVQLKEPIVEIVSSAESADAILIPHNWNSVSKNYEFIGAFIELARKFNKKIIIFYPGDSDAEVAAPNSIVFRNSQYRSKLKANEFILPGYVEDLGANLELRPRFKGNSSGIQRGDVGRVKPVVGFCGWADFKNAGERFKLLMKSFAVRPLYRQGMWWRRRALRILSRSNLVKTNFIIRKTYSGNEKTIELDPEQARQEYINNILGSDFTLCVKGDGNFSTRFYETLSLGRIPLLLDTECVLPLEDVIDYSRVILKIGHRDLYRIGRIVAAFYAKIPADQFMEMQITAREVFEHYLRLDSYFKQVFTKQYLRLG